MITKIKTVFKSIIIRIDHSLNKKVSHIMKHAVKEDHHLKLLLKSFPLNKRLFIIIIKKEYYINTQQILQTILIILIIIILTDMCL